MLKKSKKLDLINQTVFTYKIYTNIGCIKDKLFVSTLLLCQ